jgi:hypothetical protein
VREAEPMKAGGGENQRVGFPGVELSQAGVDVAANGVEPGGRKEGSQLRDAPRAARGDARCVAEECRIEFLAG